MPAKNFRRTYPLPLAQHFDLSTVGLGTFIGKPDDEDDFDLYVAAKHLVRSGCLNHLDTAINYRCQKAERALGAVLKMLHSEFGAFTDVQNKPFTVSRDELFVTTKHGYVPDDADNGVPANALIEQLVDEGLITQEDVAGGIHCIHPRFLEH